MGGYSPPPPSRTQPSNAYKRLSRILDERRNDTSGAYSALPRVPYTSGGFIGGTSGAYVIRAGETIVPREASQRVVDALQNGKSAPANLEPVERPHSVRHGPAIQIPNERIAPGTFHDLNGIA